MNPTKTDRSNTTLHTARRFARGGVVVVALAAALGLASVAHGQNRAGGAAAAGTFEVRLHRPLRAGFRDRINARGETHTTTVVTAPHHPPQTRREDESVQLQAIERVRTVDAHGKALQIEFTVEHFQTTDPSGQHDIVPAGSVLVVTRRPRGQGEPTVTMNNAPVEASVLRALSVVFTLTVDPTTDDEVFGNTARQAVGANWSVNVPVIEHELAETGAQPTVTGVVRLVRHAASHGVDALEYGMVIDATMHGMANPPAGVTFRSGAMHSIGRSVVPVNVNAPEIESEIDMTMDMVVERPVDAQGTRGEVHVTTRRMKQAVHTPM